MNATIKSVFLFACVLGYCLLQVVNANDGLLIKSDDKKGKGDLILMGKKCMPTIIKSGGKKGSDVVIIGNNDHDCHKKKAYYVPVPVVHSHHVSYKHKPVYVKHEHIMHEPVYGGTTYDHSSYHTDDHYGGQGYDHYGGMDDYYRRK